ncbi:MAG: hypothetical protein KTR15_08775 [Phycisphaeraceae bacterium]|nr:hypothetical protein [Phycisphaeraceae bacterium]
MPSKNDIHYNDQHWLLDLTCNEMTFARYQDLAKEDPTGLPEILVFSETNEIDSVKYHHKIELTPNTNRYMRFVGHLISNGLALLGVVSILYAILYLFVSGS